MDDKKVTIFALSDASDQMLKEAPVSWAIGQLQNKGLTANIRYNLAEIHGPDVLLVVTPGTSKLARKMEENSNINIPKVAESLALINGTIQKEQILMLTGMDVRGLVYGILELADRVRYSDNPI